MTRRVLSLISALAAGLGAGVTAASGPEDGLRAAAEKAGLFVGAAISSGDVGRHGGLIIDSFNSITAENAMKWSRLAPSPDVFDFAEADALIAFAEEHGLRTRGHTLFWSRLNGLPRWIEREEAPLDATAVRSAMRRHATTVLARYRGRVAQWDVVNEPLETLGPALDASNLFHRALGPGWIREAFAMAEAADPDAELYLNEVFALTNAAKFEGLEALLSRLLAEGAPIDGVGLQGHFLSGPPVRETLVDRIERLGALGLDVELTEVDVPIHHFADRDDPLRAQAEAYADIFAACLETTACRGVTVWGVTDADTWLDNFSTAADRGPARPLLFDEAGRPKPAHEAVVDTLRRRAREGGPAR